MLTTMRYAVASRACRSVSGGWEKTSAEYIAMSTSVVIRMVKSRPATTAQKDFQFIHAPRTSRFPWPTLLRFWRPAATAAPSGQAGHRRGQAQVFQHRPRRLAPVVYGAHDQVRAAHVVAAGEYFRMAGLVRQSRTAADDEPAVRLRADAVFGEPGRRTGLEAEGLQHDVGRDDFLAARRGFRARTPAPVGHQARADHAHTGGAFPTAHEFQQL